MTSNDIRKTNGVISRHGVHIEFTARSNGNDYRVKKRVLFDIYFLDVLGSAEW